MLSNVAKVTLPLNHSAFHDEYSNQTKGPSINDVAALRERVSRVSGTTVLSAKRRDNVGRGCQKLSKTA